MSCNPKSCANSTASSHSKVYHEHIFSYVWLKKFKKDFTWNQANVNIVMLNIALTETITILMARSRNNLAVISFQYWFDMSIQNFALRYRMKSTKRGKDASAVVSWMHLWNAWGLYTTTEGIFRGGFRCLVGAVSQPSLCKPPTNLWFVGAVSKPSLQFLQIRFL